MIDRGKRRILGVDISVIDYVGVVEKITAAAKVRHPLTVSAIAVHGLMTGALDPVQRYRLNRFDILTPDGQPVRWALRLLHGEALADRVYGPRLTLETCARAAELGLSIYLYGSRQEVLDALCTRLSAKYPKLRIAGAEPSRFRPLTAAEETELDRRVRDSGADIMLVGLGCPRQEVFAFEHAIGVSMPLLAVGAAFDFHAGLLPQAPPWMQASGLEWLFRLLQEPRRLWRRYLLLNPLYCLLIALQLAGLTSWQKAERVPATPVRYG
jgi:N-acetylglucosaminyldiphosphoundecaprenol N-acetyl-beta-D-mannosaminyltransferase